MAHFLLLTVVTCQKIKLLYSMLIAEEFFQQEVIQLEDIKIITFKLDQ
jgi:hypothetical protein